MRTPRSIPSLEVKDEQPLKECTGYQDNGRDTDDKVNLQSATYSVSIHEATTGKELGATELSGSDDSCPTILSFDNDNQTKVYDTPPPSGASVTPEGVPTRMDWPPA